MKNNELYKFNSISNDSSITGEVSFSDPTNIFGNINGTITMTSEDQLIQFTGSTIEGDINCFDIEVQGVIKGSIYSKGTVTIKSSAVVTGSIESKKLVVYPGSELNIEAHSE